MPSTPRENTLGFCHDLIIYYKLEEFLVVMIMHALIAMRLWTEKA